MALRATGWIRRRLALIRDDERGMTVVEGMVAALILVIGGLATFQAFDVSSRTTFRAEESQVLNNRLQAELERITERPYEQIALTATPATSTDSNDPRWRVQGTSFAIGRDGSDLREMAINGEPIPGSEDVVEGGVVDPGPVPFQTGDISGQIFRFIVWTSDPSCTECGSGMIKRLIVAARVDEAPISFERRFQEVHTDIADPDATPDDNPAPPGNEINHSTASFWLTDTTCDNVERLPVVEEPPDSGGHPTHNTHGRCADTLAYGDDRGAPDLMFTAPPELCDGCLLENQELFDYASDVTGSSDEVGLTMPWPSTDSCLLESVITVSEVRKLLEGQMAPLTSEPGDLDGLLQLPGSDASKQRRMHVWFSPPVGEPGGDLNGVGTLELYTRTVNEQLHSGEVCVVVFLRQEAQVPFDDSGTVAYKSLEVDVQYLNVGAQTNQDGFICEQELDQPFFRCQQSQWASSWKKVTVPMDFEAVDSAGEAIAATAPPGSRIGIALMVKKGGTEPADGLEFMYDAVGFESRLEIQTETIIPFG